MPDRYKDGDKKNNDNGGFNTSLTAFYHGGDLKGLTGTCEPGDDGLARIKSLGFTAVWLTPVVKQQEAIGSGSGYHGYWGSIFSMLILTWEPTLTCLSFQNVPRNWV